MENHQIDHPNSGVVIHPLSRKRQKKDSVAKSVPFLAGGDFFVAGEYTSVKIRHETSTILDGIYLERWVDFTVSYV